jgi:hypothetical protein
MEERPILDATAGQHPTLGEAARPASSPQVWPGTRSGSDQAASADVRFPGEDGGKSLAELAQRDLVATLQLLAERAQYITGASGSAIALRDGGQVFCRASAGTSAPEVGAQLQVNSGLSGESVRTRQTLRCDDAASDPRVNRESCEALGIASVVVMPLVQGEEVVGVFELFSDKPNVFDGRDIAALERMGAMVFTALEQAAAGFAPKADRAGSTLSSEGRPPSEDSSTTGAAAIPFHSYDPRGNTEHEQAAPESRVASADADEILDTGADAIPVHLGTTENPIFADAHELETESPDQAAKTENELTSSAQPETVPASSLRSAVAHLGKCQGCGFPVSEGRQLCLDCEKKKAQDPETFAQAPDLSSPAPVESSEAWPAISVSGSHQGSLFGSQDQENASWLSSHKYMLGAIAVVVAGIVAVLLVR